MNYKFLCDDDDIGSEDDGGGARQVPLSLRWETRHHWEALHREFGVNEPGAAIILALVSSSKEISYSRRKEHYSRPRRYGFHLYTYRKVVPAVDLLNDLGLIEHDRVPPGHLGWQSSIQAKPELIARTNKILHGGPKLEIVVPRETIVLRDANRNPLDYEDTAATERMRRKLAAINEAICGADIPDNLAAPVVRIFNRNFDRGGRLYAQGGGFQTLKKEARKQMTLSGERVVEIDYVTLHPAILYAQAGAPLPQDSYEIEGWPRRLVKIALLVLINAENWAKARFAIAHHETMTCVAAPGSQAAFAVADRLINDVKRVHRAIAHAFHADMGAHLMQIDSMLAETVISLMLKRGVVVLPIHDSFLVPASKAGLLEEAMYEAAHRAGFPSLQVAYA